MSLEDFQLLDNEPIDNSIIERDFSNVHHQQGANLNDPDQNVHVFFGESNNYHQIGNSHLEFEITVRNTVGNFTHASDVRLINNAFAYCSQKGRLSTTSGSNLEHNKYIGQVSTIMCLLTSKDSDLSSCFDKNGEKALDDNNPLKQILINNHATDVNKSKIKEQLPLEHIFGVCRPFEK